MTTGSRPSCDRTRALLSRKLDGALSELELRAVDAHTARCAECRAFEAQTWWITAELRHAPLAAIPEPVAVRAIRRRFPMRIAANAASAAALLAVTIGGASLAIDRSGSSANAPTFGLTAADARLGDAGIREIRRAGLQSGELRILPESDPPNGVKPALPEIDG
jgi:predicted anti-sigma-YlaC factor YlaD